MIVLDLQLFSPKNRANPTIIRNQSEHMNQNSSSIQINYNIIQMTSETQEIITSQIVPFCKPLNNFSLQNLKLLIQQTRSVMSPREFQAHLDQWKILAKKLNNNDKLTYLKQQNCRALLIELIRQDAMHLFNSSYLNRAKIDQQYIRYLKQLGPYFFIEAIMVVSKLKTIHKHFYRKLSKSISQNHVTIKILRILELCNQKKRSINNNKAKFLCIVEDETDRLEITKELGKMLREAWKREKSKEFDQSEELYQEQCSYEEPQMEYVKTKPWEQQLPARQYAKELVKQPSEGFHQEYNFELSDHFMSFENMPQNTYRYSDNSEILL